MTGLSRLLHIYYVLVNYCWLLVYTFLVYKVSFLTCLDYLQLTSWRNTDYYRHHSTTLALVCCNKDYQLRWQRRVANRRCYHRSWDDWFWVFVVSCEARKPCTDVPYVELNAYQSVICLCLDKITRPRFSCAWLSRYVWGFLDTERFHECIWAFCWRFLFGTFAALRDSVDPATFKRLDIQGAPRQYQILLRSALPLHPPQHLVPPLPPQGGVNLDFCILHKARLEDG
jgi:hypothetical protein